MKPDDKPDPRQVTVYDHVGQPEPAPVKSAPNPRHSSEESGHRTPPIIVERARLVLGGIDLDPFSTPEANETVGAERFYVGGTGGVIPCVHGMGYAVDGFAAHWGPLRRGALDELQAALPPEEPSRVFCNPPGGRTDGNASSQKRAWFKLAEEYGAGRVESAVFVCFSIELLQMTQYRTPDGLQIPLSFPICFPQRRVAYRAPDGKIGRSPPHASCLVLLPKRLTSGSWSTHQVEKFIAVFGELGRVVVPWRSR